jgi:hypothetical protein
MAALGMLAPLIESLFVQCFAGIRRILATSAPPLSSSHPRWQWPTRKQWDCHYYLAENKRKKGLSKGILELATVIGLSARMPDDLEPMLEALFEYRNAMFHYGFEWPPIERQKFDIRRAKWPSNWFSVSTSGNQPWIFYVTDTFIDHCFVVMEAVLSGIGAFAREQSLLVPNTPRGRP